MELGEQAVSGAGGKPEDKVSLRSSEEGVSEEGVISSTKDGSRD